MHEIHMREFRQYTYDVLTKCFKSGRSTLIDLSWYVSMEDIAKFYDGPILQALIYCPFDEVIQRIARRNQEAAVHNMAFNRRFFKEGVSFFLGCYDFNEDPAGAVDMISKDSCERIFEFIASQIKAQPLNAKEFSASELEEQKNIFLQKFANTSKLYVVPRCAYDIFINTQELSPEAAAQKIIEF